VLNLAGTPRLLVGDITQTMLGDGFMSRMITYCNDKDPSAQTDEERLAAKLAMMESSAEKGMDANALNAARFFKQLWQDGDHPQGAKFFDPPLDMEPEALTEVIREHFTNPDLEARYIRPGRTRQDRARAAALCLRAQQRFVVPKGMRGLPADEAIASLITRAELKLNMLTSILTLIADPKAEYLNLDIMEWAEEVLWVAQRDFYHHLLGSDSNLTSIMPKYRVNTEALAKLRPAVEPGGLLYAGDMVKANALRESSRAWRSLVSDLKTDPNSERCKLAHEMLHELNVGYQDTGENNSRVFFIKPETKEE
jgi:flagellar biosynthesis regulator FlaF